MKFAGLTDSCRLCSIAKGVYAYGVADKPLFETSNFIVIPSIGAFVDGWVMIVPKRHVYDMSAFYKAEEFLELSKKVHAHVEEKYGSLVMFEHGASYSGSPTGCGVDHAHYHFVPYSESLLPDLIASGYRWDVCEARDISIKTKGKDYLFYSDAISTENNISGYLHIIDAPISQFFRKLLALKTNNQDFSDYKAHLFIDKAHKTAEILSSAA